MKYGYRKKVARFVCQHEENGVMTDIQYKDVKNGVIGRILKALMSCEDMPESYFSKDNSPIHFGEEIHCMAFLSACNIYFDESTQEIDFNTPSHKPVLNLKMNLNKKDEERND